MRRFLTRGHWGAKRLPIFQKAMSLGMITAIVDEFFPARSYFLRLFLIRYDVPDVAKSKREKRLGAHVS
jgi:hypothetical protein